MRIRSTKPEFWRSERVAGVDWEARLVLKGLESYVDDNGVGKDDLALIVADVFPRDLSRNPPGTLQKVSEAISDLENAGLLWRYEADGTKLLYIAFWESVQRIEKPTRGRFPRPDGTLEYRASQIRESSRNPPGILPEPSGLEQRNRGTEDQVDTRSSADANDPEFDAWWSIYPRKVGKGQARRAYLSASKKADAPTLLAAVEDFARACEGTDPKYIPYPATWLNGERWLDEAAVEPELTVAQQMGWC